MFDIEIIHLNEGAQKNTITKFICHFYARIKIRAEYLLVKGPAGWAKKSLTNDGKNPNERTCFWITGTTPNIFNNS